MWEIVLLLRSPSAYKPVGENFVPNTDNLWSINSMAMLCVVLNFMTELCEQVADIIPRKAATFMQVTIRKHSDLGIFPNPFSTAVIN